MNAGAPLGRSVRVEAVSKSFRLKRGASVQAIKRVDLEIAEGEFVALIGPSGSGKSTILRMIAGLDEPTSGSVTIAGEHPRVLARDHRDDQARLGSAREPGQRRRRRVDAVADACRFHHRVVEGDLEHLAPYRADHRGCTPVFALARTAARCCFSFFSYAASHRSLS